MGGREEDLPEGRRLINMGKKTKDKRKVEKKLGERKRMKGSEKDI